MRSPAIQGRHDREEPYVLDEQVGFALRQAQQRHTTIFAAEIIEDLTPTQWAALAKLRELGDCSQNHLGRLTAMDAATIKGVIDRLTARGFTTVRPDPRDGRRILVALTPTGSDLYDRAAPIAALITEKTLEPLGEDERSYCRLAAPAGLRSDNRGCLLRGRRVAAAMGAHDAVDDRHADTGQVAEPHALQQRLARRVLRAIHEHEVGGAADLDQPQSSARMRAVLPVAKQNATSAGTSPSDDSSATMRRMPSG